jgi:hypothetical protein
MANVKNLSFLIGSYKEMTKTFGFNTRTDLFFIKQMGALSNISQISGDDVTIIQKITGIGTGKIRNEREKNIESFIHAMNVMEGITSGSNMRPVSLLNMFYNKEIDEDMYKIIGQIYNINTNINLERKEVNNNFGVLQDSKISSKNDTDLDKFINFCNKYKEFGMNKGIRYKNPNCICSSDSYYISCSFKRLNESLSSMYQYLTSMNEADETEEVYVNYSDGCHGGTRTDLAATKELRNLSIDYKKACDELRKEIVKETNKNKSANEEYER